MSKAGARCFCELLDGQDCFAARTDEGFISLQQPVIGLRLGLDVAGCCQTQPLCVQQQQNLTCMFTTTS